MKTVKTLCLGLIVALLVPASTASAGGFSFGGHGFASKERRRRTRQGTQKIRLKRQFRHRRRQHNSGRVTPNSSYARIQRELRRYRKPMKLRRFWLRRPRNPLLARIRPHLMKQRYRGARLRRQTKVARVAESNLWRSMAAAKTPQAFNLNKTLLLAQIAEQGRSLTPRERTRLGQLARKQNVALLWNDSQAMGNQGAGAQVTGTRATGNYGRSSAGGTTAYRESVFGDPSWATPTPLTATYSAPRARSQGHPIEGLH